LNDDHLGLIGKCVVDFLLAFIELFFARCYGWCATSDWPKISGTRGRPPPTILLRKL